MITKQEYPRIFKALTYLHACNGAINRLEPTPNHFVAPDGDLGEIEAQLTRLTDDELEVFVDGDAAKAAEIVEKYGIIEAAIFVEEYFEQCL